MIGEFVSSHIFMCSIFLVGIVGLILQIIVGKVLTDYVKASEQMDTTQKKNLINLKNQFETIYGLECEVRNPKAYVDKYLVKLRVMGISYMYWDKLSYIMAGFVFVVAAGEILYGYWKGNFASELLEIGIACGLVLSCLFLSHHIFGVRGKKEQIQIQLDDYLENYVTNRLVRGKKIAGSEMQNKQNENPKQTGEFEDAIAEKCDEESERQAAAAKEDVKETEADLLEEFVQSFLA